MVNFPFQNIASSAEFNRSWMSKRSEPLFSLGGNKKNVRLVCDSDSDHTQRKFQDSRSHHDRNSCNEAANV